MLIESLIYAPNEYAVKLAQDRKIDSRRVREIKFNWFKGDTMSLAEKAAKKAAALRAGKKSPKPEAKSTKTTAKKSAATAKGHKSSGRKSRATDADKAKVAKLYKAGKTSSQISDEMGWTEKGNWPYQYTLGVIRQLRKAGTIGYRK